MEIDKDPVKRFLHHYYDLVDDNKAVMVEQLYRENSVLTFEGHEFHGQNGIRTKLDYHNFQGHRHFIDTIDIQPFNKDGALVVVTGRLRVAHKNKTDFRQTFCLVPTPQGSFYVSNDMFWLNEA